MHNRTKCLIGSSGILLGFCVGFLNAENPPKQAKQLPPAPYEYRIGEGDTLQVTVLHQPEASAQVLVRSDGMITLALPKEIFVAGLTPNESQVLIAEKLSKFYTDPEVTVIVSSSQSKKVYLVGKVNKSGTIPYIYQMNVLQALAEGGGLSDYAKRKSIHIQRTVNGKQQS